MKEKVVVLTLSVIFSQVMKANATSRVPDCFQKLPRRVNIPENGSQILSIAVDGQGRVNPRLF